jgi:hypothetical protein
MAFFRALFLPIAFLFVISPTYADVRKDFCKLEKLLNRRDIAIPIMTISATTKLLKSSLASILYINETSKRLERSAETAKTLLQAIGILGPAKFFVSAALPFMDKSSKLLRKIERKTRLQAFHSALLKFDLVWSVLSTVTLALKVVSIEVCEKAQNLGLEACKRFSCHEIAEAKAPEKKTAEDNKAVPPQAVPSQAVPPQADPLEQRHKALMKEGQRQKPVLLLITPPARELSSCLHKKLKTFKITKKLLTSIEPSLQSLENKIKAFESRFKAVEEILERFQKILDKEYCVNITFKKWCYQAKDVLQGLSGFAKVAEKPLMDLIEKAITPLVEELKEKLPKTEFGPMAFLTKFRALEKRLQGVFDEILRHDPQVITGHKAKLQSMKDALHTIP